MLHDGREALVVDPGEAAPVIEALQTHGLRLSGILVTHHHGDHIGGVDALRNVLHGSVYGPARERIPAPSIPVSDADTLAWNGLRFEVMEVPGHTAGHVAYWCPDMDGAPLLFCGDTLFSAGCGRLFEGTPSQMSTSLARLAALAGNTRVCCTHEYTQSNLRFALTVEPGNAELAAHARHCDALRRQGRPTLPSTIALERAINPFLRCREPAVAAAARQRDPSAHDAVAVFAALREWKNEFR
jgi:hydroxyacylglutathione hydrolase